MQEILLAVHLKRHAWTRPRRSAPWRSAIARNKLIDALRKRGRRVRRIDNLSTPCRRDRRVNNCRWLKSAPTRKAAAAAARGAAIDRDESASIRETAAKLSMSERRGAGGAAPGAGQPRSKAAEGLMDTNELIRSLAADHGWRARPVGIVLAIALALALPFTMMMFMMRLGMRPDRHGRHGKSVLRSEVRRHAGAGFCAVVLAARLVRPGADIRKAAWLLGIPVLLLAGGIAADAMVMTSPWTKRLVGTNSLICLIGNSGAVVAAADRRAGRAEAWRRHAADADRRRRRTSGGRDRSDVLRLALHRQLAAVRRHLVQHRAGGGRAWSGRLRGGGFCGSDLKRRLARAAAARSA